VRPGTTAPSLLSEGPIGNVPFLDTPGIPPFDRRQAWRWIFYAVAGFLAGQIAAVIFGIVAGDVAGKTSAQLQVIASASVPPEWYVVSTLAGIWIGFVGAPWLASRTQGTGRFLRDLGVRFRVVDLLGLVIGVAGQGGISLLYAPFQHDIHNFNGPSQKLTGGSHGVGILVIALASVVVVPFAEELFFRGLLFKGLLRLCTPAGGGTGRARALGVVLAVVIDGALFGLAHGELVQLAGLALFGMVLAVVSYKTGRLGMNMMAHGSFNLVAVLVIINTRGGVIH
jgi:membrane protease YdiL (CAAX protease family)